MAVGLCMGGNAWAQVTTTLLEYGTNDVPWTDSRAAEWTGKAVTVDNDVVKYSGSDNADFSTSKTISPTSGNIINLTAVWRARSNTGRYWSNSCGIYFRFGNIVVAQNDQDKSHGYVFAGLSNMSSVTTFTAGSYRTDIASCTWLKIEAEINTKTNTLTSFTIKSEDGATTYVSRTNVALSDPDYTTVEFGFQRGASHSTEKQEQLKSIKITETTPSVEYADYTVHFVDNNGATVKDDEVRSGEVGATVNANSADQTTFYSGGYKYVYANDGGGVEVVKAGTSEMTVTYTKYGQYTYNVYAVNSSDVKLQEDPIATATVYTDETATLTWSKYIKIGGTWYSTAETTFRTTATEAGSRNVVYSASNIAYFFEMENLTRSGGSYLTEESTSYSNYSRLRFSRGSTHYTPALAAGYYNLNITVYNSNDGSNNVYVYTRSGVGTLSDVLYTHEATKGTTTINTVIAVPEGYSIAFNGDEGGSSNNKARMDYMTLTLTGVPASITSAGYATFSSAYDLDFTDPISGLTAYKATSATASNITMEEVEGKVKAGDGLVLKGSAGTYYVPVTTGASTIYTTPATITMWGNIGSTTQTVSKAGSGTNFVLSIQSGNVVFAPIDDDDATLNPGQAALWANVDVSTARALKIVFADDETTGVNDVRSKMSEVRGTYYNLNGQRVEKPAKGLYIVGGKKVVMK